MIPNPILRVLSTIRQFDIPALLMGGQACVLYGAAEYSRDLDLAVLANEQTTVQLAQAMQSLEASVIAVPPFDRSFLERGHAIHFSVPYLDAPPLRVDVMSRMRGVEAFDVLWQRRTTMSLMPLDASSAIDVDVKAET